jgi:hypothetical protein
MDNGSSVLVAAQLIIVISTVAQAAKAATVARGRFMQMRRPQVSAARGGMVFAEVVGLVESALMPGNVELPLLRIQWNRMSTALDRFCLIESFATPAAAPLSVLSVSRVALLGAVVVRVSKHGHLVLRSIGWELKSTWIQGINPRLGSGHGVALSRRCDHAEMSALPTLGRVNGHGVLAEFLE